MTTAQFLEVELRLERNKKRQLAAVYSQPAERETGRGGLHQQIADYCNVQWPRWKFIQARSDMPSTIAEGAQDFTVFLPGGRTVCIECKARNEKLSEKQQIWAKEMSMLGHEVFLVRSMDDFLKVIK